MFIVKKIFLALSIIFIVSGCATFKIEDDSSLIVKSAIKADVSIVKDNEFPGGYHCFEPYLFVISIGIIPTHCVETYRVTIENQDVGNVEVTSMQGWVALILAMFPSWQYGYGSDMENKIKEYLANKSK